MESSLDSDREIVRSALRVSTRVWSKLEKKSQQKGMTEAEILREYILLCPYVDPDGPVMQAALKGIDEYKDDDKLLRITVPALHSSPAASHEELSDEDKSESPSDIVSASVENIHTPVKHSPATKKGSRWRLVGRILFLDLPLLVLCMTYAFFMWGHHVYDEYLLPQLEAVVFTPERSEVEITYYKRPCTADDMTTKSGENLFLPLDATPEEAYQHQLRHGFTVFRSVLAEDTATELRNFITARNRNLTEEESIFVIENTNRFSFGLGTEEPSVVKAMKEIGNHERLRPALEKIIGPNPALIEMTAITASYGAVAQYWHDDVVATASAINYARTFGPSYSVFIQLQNTTKGMGATGVCPGTHYCSDGFLDKFCEKEGFQLVNEEGYWATGDALLMNMNSYHRGSAHTDPDALDRVMLILTFVPRPEERAESRQMSQGITFSLRWDMWGHTLHDLAHADSAMNQPFATLRALGLFNKVSKDAWGIDYISGSSMRMANEDNGFRRDELDTFLERGGFPFLPYFLQGEVSDEENWHEYLIRTFLLCKEFLFKMCCCFAVLPLLASVFSRSQPRSQSFFGAMFRSASLASIAYLLFEGARYYVDNTGWAKDIKASRRYASIVPLYGLSEDLPTTFPTKYDVLIETRYGSRQLHMYNDFIEGHPGNRKFLDLLPEAAEVFTDYPFEFQEAAAEYVMGQMAMSGSRFLYQAPYGAWYLLDTDAVTFYVKSKLAMKSSKVVEYLSKEIRFLISDLLYGIYRDYSMSSVDMIPFLEDIGEKLMTGIKSRPKQSSQIRQQMDFVSDASAFIFPRTFSLPPISSFEAPTRWITRRFPFSAVQGKEPFQGAWLQEGDLVDGFIDNYRYMGTITHVTAHGNYHISYPDGDDNWNDTYEILPFVPYQLGEKLDVLIDNEYMLCEIVAVMEDGTYHVITDHDDEYYTDKTLKDFRRYPSKLRKKRIYQAAY
ncbi:hypothetical protein FisN_4Lh421 [Fistulifera solaris]|uniref:Uncharacterized protein n=1 Tax=Fistulifera solaris TaxID=1519565 RepID=A0A1Z5KDL1_FISSO|nr:hypothetical protein FisN_4Lh421 [Fistulifera solaris]|eukprot:GAX24307.1 hypothetical protein FisN_4Lh421 [Fistulifera solaris]